MGGGVPDPEQTLAVAIMSYNGGVDIGLIGDYDAMPDLEDLAAMFEDALREPREAAADLKPAGRPPG
ncbi:MAG: WS/DGAT domain-containing protein [Solirubrobacteraceae bacterium]